MVIADLRGLGLDRDGSIALVEIDSHISEHAEAAIRNAKGLPSDAVVWEEVEERTSEQVELSAVFVVFMVVAALLAAMGIYQNSAILIVGAMVVGPEFGPLAGLCVALVQRHVGLARRSARALDRRLRDRDRDRLRDDAAVPGGRACSTTTSASRTTRSRTSSARRTSSPSSSRPAPGWPGC